MTNGSRTTPDAALKILVIEEDPVRSAILEAGLREAGFLNVTLLGNATGLLDQVYRIDPDVILIDLENPSRDVLEQMFQVSRIVRRPIAMFVDQSDRQHDGRPRSMPASPPTSSTASRRSA